MQIKTHKFFNDATRHAMFEQVKGYVAKPTDPEGEVQRFQAQHQLERVYRFDLGENADGYSPHILAYLDALRSDGQLGAKQGTWFNAYPDLNHTRLKRRLAERFMIPEAWILVGAGLDSIVDLITRVFLEQRDAYLMPVPSFFLFEEFSERMGAIPYFLPLQEEDGFQWTTRTTDRFKALVDKARPKLIWIANPNNPTGHFIQDMVLEELLDFASAYNAFMVIDEAYGEYTDPPGAIASAARFLSRYPNLMVLRTFSKAFGLAGLRIGYLMCASPEIHEGLQVHQHNFSVTQISADLARIALDDEDFLLRSRAETQSNARFILAALDTMPRLKAIPTQSSIFMLKHRWVPGPDLKRVFEQKGIIASAIDISGIRDQGYLRFTVRNRADNDYLIQACREIHEGLGERRTAARFNPLAPTPA